MDSRIQRLLRLSYYHEALWIPEMVTAANKCTARTESMLHEIAHYVGVHHTLPKRLRTMDMDNLDAWIREWSGKKQVRDEAITVTAVDHCLRHLGLQTPGAWVAQVHAATRNTNPQYHAYLRSLLGSRRIRKQGADRAIYILTWLES